MHIFMHFAKRRFRGISSKVHFLRSTLEIFFQCRTRTCGCSRYHFFMSELVTRLTLENIIIALTFETYLTLLFRERDPLRHKRDLWIYYRDPFTHQRDVDQRTYSCTECLESALWQSAWIYAKDTKETWINAWISTSLLAHIEALCQRALSRHFLESALPQKYFEDFFPVPPPPAPAAAVGPFFFKSELVTRFTLENIIIALTFEKYLTLLSRERETHCDTKETCEYIKETYSHTKETSINTLINALCRRTHSRHCLSCCYAHPSW